MFLIINTSNNDFTEVILARSGGYFKINPAPSRRVLNPAGMIHLAIHPCAKSAGYSGRCWIKKFSGRQNQSEKLLPAIGELLKKNKITLGQLKGIGVVSGPGGFSSLRIGVATANALAYALKISAAGIKINEFKNKQELVKKIAGRLKKVRKGRIVLPEYGREPNITIKK